MGQLLSPGLGNSLPDLVVLRCSGTRGTLSRLSHLNEKKLEGLPTADNLERCDKRPIRKRESRAPYKECKWSLVLSGQQLLDNQSSGRAITILTLVAVLWRQLARSPEPIYPIYLTTQPDCLSVM